jgi:cephalosporin hydroxylase
MVSRGSYLALEDTRIDGVPSAAVREFIEQGGAREFEPDFSPNTMALTFNPGGWLKRM